MSARKVLCGVFDSVTATSDGIDRLDPSEDWRPYVVAAIPGHWVPTKQKTGLGPASSTQRVEAMSNFAFAPVGPRDHGDEARKATSCAWHDGLRPPRWGGLIDLPLPPSSYRFEAICCAVSIIAASIGLTSWK